MRDCPVEPIGICPPALTQWMASTNSGADAQEVLIDNDDLIGVTICELDAQLPVQV